jgi:CheY-like chemotaxis protein/glycine cleavage system H lipoate-binding protein
MPEPARILVVDDEPSVCKAVASALVTEGYRVDTALSAEAALEKAGGSQFDVVVTDLMMPGLSGMDLLKIAAERMPDTKVIMITGYPSVKSAVEAMRLGAFDFIPKPFTPKELRGLVSRALASRRYRGEEAVVPPSGVRCIPENSWAAAGERGEVRVGVHHLFLKTIPDIKSVRLADEGAVRYQGEACAEVTDSKGNVHKVWSPVSGTVVAVNRTIIDDRAALLKDPYGAGWLFKMAPANLEDDFKNLVPARP